MRTCLWSEIESRGRFCAREGCGLTMLRRITLAFALTFPVPVKVKGREWEQGRQLRSCCFHRDKSWRLLRSGWRQWRPHEVTVGLCLKVGFYWLVGCEMWVRSRRALSFLTPVTGRGELPFPELKKTIEEQVWDGEKVSYVQKWACRAEMWLQIVLEVGSLLVVFYATSVDRITQSEYRR